VIILITFHVFWGQEGSRLLHVPSQETVRRWVDAIKNGREETDVASSSGAPTSATDEGHMEKVKSVLERTHTISRMATAT
jgi:transposase